MRVLLVTDTSGHMRGGVPAETRQLMRGLLSRGHSVALCGDVALPGTEGAEHHPIAVPIDGALATQVSSVIAAFRPDVVHVVSMSSRGILQLRAPLAAVPWVMTCHSIPPHERKLAGLHGNETVHYGVRAIRFFANSAAWWWLLHRGVVPRVIVHCDWMKSLLATYGQPTDTISLILLGCDVDATRQAPLGARPTSSSPRLVTVAGIAHTKGYHDAINAVAILRRRWAGIRYQIIGEVRDGSYLRHLRSLIARLDLTSSVQITPDLPEHQKQHALSSADLYLQPSHEEGFCLAYLESAQRVPRLVGTDTGAIARISDDDAGVRVVPPRRPALMTEAIASLLDQPLPADLMQTRAARLGDHFAWSRHLDAHLALYQSLRPPGP